MFYLFFSHFLFTCRSLQGIPEAVSESDQRGGCAC
ncbi:unnamed protein product [Prunus armeniaca]|uniref:Uncharacterized protein n=1 Tax=Prunus armeniaca TaxID=36596 RepID=A0A6J5Y142_PRUAR|nr:unnamed protein product [Prunus armeniaca]